MERFDPVEVLGAHRAAPGHPRAVRAHPPGAAAEAARGGAHPLRPVEPAGRRPRRGAVPARGEAGGDRVAGPDRPRVLLGQRGRRASAPSAPRSGSPTPVRSGRSLLGAVHIVDADGNELPVGRGGPGVVRDRRAASSTTATPRRPPAAFNDRGWGTLGDIGWVDDEGYLYLTDRVSNMIISGGVNIYPREVEDVLVVHPAVADVAVDRRPRPRHGRGGPRRRAGRRRRRRPDALGRGAHRRSAGSTSPHFKCPRSVVFLDELPRLPTGKLAKRLLPDSVLVADD